MKLTSASYASLIENIDLKTEERVDRLRSDRVIIQRHRGHKATSDDQLLAWAGLEALNKTLLERRDVESASFYSPMVLDLGAGKGTVTLWLSALIESARFVGIEAFEQSYELSLKNRKINRLIDRFTPIFGDLRSPHVWTEAKTEASRLERSDSIDSGNDRGFDLICGAPPFMPLGSGVIPKDPQRASGRFELKGGIEEYLEAVEECLAVDGVAVILMDGSSQARTLLAIQSRPALKIRRVVRVLPRPHRLPTYLIFEIDRVKTSSTSPPPPPRWETLSMRGEAGEDWSQAYRDVRARLGITAQHPDHQSSDRGPLVMIPSRLSSKRLPNKPLLPLGGEPIIWRVYERISMSEHVEDVIVVTEDLSIAEAIKSRGGQALVTLKPCDSGSHRVAVALQQLTAPTPSHLEGSPSLRSSPIPDWIINVQGDEPLLPLTCLDALIESLSSCDREGIRIATLAAPIDPKTPDHLSPHRVKVAINQQGEALYFSRQPIGFHVHIGVYAFRREVISSLHIARTPLSTQEDLEQLTWLERGERIRVVITDSPPPPSIDTPHDYEEAVTRWRELTNHD